MDSISRWIPLVLAAALLWLGASTLAPVADAATITVGPGDTLTGLAARQGTSVGDLARANGISNPNDIRAGQRLRVPETGGEARATPAPATRSGRVYRVRRGDTLSSIAARFGTTPGAIARINGIRNPHAIRAGRRLRLPPSATVRPSTPAGPSPARSGPQQPAPAGRALVTVLLDGAAARHGVTPRLARAVAWQESGFRQSAISSSGAIGVMQLMPATAAWLGPAVLGRRIDPHRVRDNVDGGVAYLAWLRSEMGSTRAAIAAYYQGPGSVRRDGLRPDTRRYVSSVLALVGRV